MSPKKIALAGLLIGIFVFVSLGIVAWKFVPSANVSSASSSPPVIVGWSGVTLNEVAKFASGNPPSQVFPGQVASDMEYVVQTLAAKGLNGVKLHWDPSCTTSPSASGSIYNAGQVANAIQVASFYHFWLVLEYHGYTDPFTSTTAACWLSFWSGVVSQFKNSYSQIVYAPENEPRYSFTGSACSGATACVAYLSTQYQSLIDQTRNQGDTHWIVVENVCSFGCGFCPTGNGDCSAAVNGYPTVTDPQSHIFIDLHSYLSSTTNWTNSTADANANAYYNTVVAGVAKTGWPALNTEGGADQLTSLNPPDVVLSGSAGYSKTTFRFIQTLTSLYDNNSPQRINYLWWPAGDWTDTPGAGALGALQCNSSPKGWGCLLQTARVAVTPPPSLTADFTFSPSNPRTGQTVTFTATVSGGTPSYTLLWNFGDGATGTSNPMSHAYTASNTYTVTLKATDSASNSATASHVVVVSAQPPPTANTPPTLTVPGPQIVRAGSLLTFKVTASDTDGEQVFNFTSPLPTGASFNPTTDTFTWTPVAAQAGGSWTVAFTATDNGSPPLSVTKLVQIYVTP